EAGGGGEDRLAGHLVQGEQDARYRRGTGAFRGQFPHYQVCAVGGGGGEAAGQQRGEQGGEHRAAEDEVEGDPGQPGVVAEEHLCAQGLRDLGDGGRGERRVVRDDVAGHRQAGGEPFGDLVAVLGGHPVDHHGEDVAAVGVVGAVGVAGL